MRALRLLEPRLTDIEVLVVNSEPVIHADVGGERLLPLTAFGEGMAQVTDFVLSLHSTDGGMLLIDEFENGIHYSVLPGVWSLLGELSKATGTQVIATTHSRECDQAAHDSLREDAQMLRLFRLTRDEAGGSRVNAYDGETLDAALKVGLEVR